jgi:hypothetical protein
MGIANPAGAFALAAVAVLVALTLWQRRTRVRRVSSLLLWRQIAAAPLERRRFRADLLFLLQLALLLALIGGFLRPYLDGPPDATSGTALVAVLDCSASMQTREDHGSRFALARSRLHDVLSSLPPQTPVMVVTAAERPHVVQRWTTDTARVTAVLDALAPVDTPTRLASAVELALAAARRRPGTSVVVLTDLPPALQRGPVRWIQVGRNGDNVGITALRVDAPPFGDRRDARVVASVRNFAAAPRVVTMDASIDDVPWARRVVRLPPRGSEDVLFDRPAASGVVRVRLTGDDALAVDDEALGWLPAPASLDLVLVTEADPMAAAFSTLVAALPDARLEVVNAAGWRERGGADDGGAVAVFDRLALESHGPALWVAPPPGEPVCRGTRRLDGAAVVDWDDTHPIVDGLTGLQALEVGPSTALGMPAWAHAIVQASSRTAAFPFLLAGERDGRRIACLAATLPVPPTSSDAMPLLVLTLSTLRWLSADPAAAPAVVETGIASRSDDDVTSTSPDVRVSASTVVAERIGLHRLSRSGGGERVVLANLVDATESDVGRDGGGDWPAPEPVVTMATLPTARAELAWWLYAAGAALLGIEWMVGARR